MIPEGYTIRPFTMDDYPAAYALWQATEGIGLSSADRPEAIARYLQRNPGLSFVVYWGDVLVGAVLCGHDGRRGYLHHLAVAPEHRHRGLGRLLVEHCLRALSRQGIAKCHLFVLRQNDSAIHFWRHLDWVERVELVVFSKVLE